MKEPLRFDAGRISLDLLATLGNRREERLSNSSALAAWLVAAGLSSAPPRVTGDDLARTRSLRAALFAVIDAELTSTRPSAAHVRAINAAATVSARAPRLVSGAAGLRVQRPAPGVTALLGDIARDAIDLLAGPERWLLRGCAAEDCSGVYVDRSRGHTRRWCSAARCGNRARVAAHRSRQREPT